MDPKLRLGKDTQVDLKVEKSEYETSSNVWPPRFESDEDLDELKKRHAAMLDHYRKNPPSGDLAHFIRQCESSANLEEGGLKDD